MPSASSGSSRMPVRPPSFLPLFWARGFSEFSYQIATVAVVWQVYSLTNSAYCPRHVGLVAVHPLGASGFLRGHCRRPLRPQAGGCSSGQIVEGADRGILGLGQLCVVAETCRKSCCMVDIWHRHVVESPAAAALLPGLVDGRRGCSRSAWLFHPQRFKWR